MKKHLFYIFVFCSFFGHAQKYGKDINTKIKYVIEKGFTQQDSIHKVLKKHRRNKKDVDLMITTFEHEDYKHGIIYAHSALGRQYRDISLFNESVASYKKALQFTQEIEDVDTEIRMLNAIASVYRRQDQIKEALNYHQEALNKALSVENPTLEVKKSISISENGMGNLYLSLKQYELALKEFSKSIVVQQELNDRLGLAINHQNIGYAEEELGNIDKAFSEYHKALKYNNILKNRIGKIICGYSISNVLIKQKKYKQAHTTVDSVLPLAIKQNDKYYLSSTYNALGLSQIYLNKLVPAKSNLEAALNMAKKYNVQNIVVKANENLALLYEKQKKYNKAYTHYKIAREEEAKTLSARNFSYVSILTSQYEKERADNKYNALAKQNEIAKLELDRIRNIFIMVLSTLILLGIILYVISRQRTLKNEKNILALKQEALQSQMNPHFVFNALNSIKLYIINNEQKNAVRYLNKFAKLIRKILEASKVKETTLAEELETMDLYMSIENIRFNNEINYKTNISSNLNTTSIKVPPLVIQPFLENALWHGLSSKEGEKEVILSIEKVDNDFIEIAIEDNGIGRQEAAKIKAAKTLKRKSIGIELTKDRLRSFVKDFQKNFSLRYFDLTDDQGKNTGTRASIRIPIT